MYEINFFFRKSKHFSAKGVRGLSNTFGKLCDQTDQDRKINVYIHGKDFSSKAADTVPPYKTYNYISWRFLKGIDCSA